MPMIDTDALSGMIDPAIMGALATLPGRIEDLSTRVCKGELSPSGAAARLGESFVAVFEAVKAGA